MKIWCYQDLIFNNYLLTRFWHFLRTNATWVCLDEAPFYLLPHFSVFVKYFMPKCQKIRLKNCIALQFWHHIQTGHKSFSSERLENASCNQHTVYLLKLKYTLIFLQMLFQSVHRPLIENLAWNLFETTFHPIIWSPHCCFP